MCCTSFSRWLSLEQSLLVYTGGSRAEHTQPSSQQGTTTHVTEMAMLPSYRSVASTCCLLVRACFFLCTTISLQVGSGAACHESLKFYNKVTDCSNQVHEYLERANLLFGAGAGRVQWSIVLHLC